jgi:hypothetical protein
MNVADFTRATTILEVKIREEEKGEKRNGRPASNLQDAERSR